MFSTSDNPRVATRLLVALPPGNPPGLVLKALSGVVSAGRKDHLLLVQGQ